MAAVAGDFCRVSRVAARLAAIFAAFYCGAGASGMGALVILFHDSPRLRLDAPGSS